MTNSTSRPLDLAIGAHGIPTLAKLLLICMAKLGNSTHHCFASQRRLAKMCECSVRSIGRQMDHLRMRGWITRVEDPKRKTDCYQLNTHMWVSGQAVFQHQSDRPARRGQNVRQNHNGNLKMNLRQSGAVKSQSSANEKGGTILFSVLAGMARKMEVDGYESD